MSKTSQKLIPNVFLCAVIAASSGFCLSLGFPSDAMTFFPWVALAPFLVVLATLLPEKGVIFGLIMGIIFFLGVFSWILVVQGYQWIHHVLLALYLGSYLGAFGLALSFLSSAAGIGVGLLAAPFLWVALEFARSNLSFLSLPWVLLAHSQYKFPIVMQIASVTGAYGLSFLIVFANAGIAALCIPAVKRWVKPFESKPFSAKVGCAIAVTAAACVGASLVFGWLKVSRPLAGERVKVSVVQGNIEQKKKWNPQFARAIMQTYSDLTAEASKDRPQLIVWPETATPGAIDRHIGLYNQVLSIAQASGASLLFGSAQRQKMGDNAADEISYMNSAFLIRGDTQLQKSERYDKIKLFPFGEYLPYKDSLPWSLINVPDVKGYVSGKEYKVFEMDRVRFAATICWENLFPEMVRQFVKRGAQFVVNITNEAWFGETAAPEQFLSMNVFRAVENGIYVVRCANTGISCFIDPCGRVVDRVKDEKGKDVFVRGYLAAEIIPLQPNTLYTRYGDWLAWLCVIISAGFLSAALLKKVQRPDEP
jgi:apolipoprotein N-acyltransferase